VRRQSLLASALPQPGKRRHRSARVLRLGLRQSHQVWRQCQRTAPQAAQSALSRCVRDAVGGRLALDLQHPGSADQGACRPGAMLAIVRVA
jgi:hypothetical protein